MLSQFKKKFEPLVAIIARPFLSWNPSVLTMLSLLASLLFFIGILEHIYWLSLLSMFGFLFDAFDGYVARKNNKVTKFGAFLDSSLDRIADFFLITSFGFARLVSWELVVLVFATTIFISYLQARAEAVFGKVKAVGIMQRTERILFIFLAFFLFLLFQKAEILLIVFLLLVFLNLITIYQRFTVVAKN